MAIRTYVRGLVCRPVSDPGDDECAWCGTTIVGTAPRAAGENGAYQGHGLCSKHCGSSFDRWLVRSSTDAGRRALSPAQDGGERG